MMRPDVIPRLVRGVAGVGVALALLLAACDAGAPSLAPSPPDREGASPAFHFKILQWRCRHADAITATETVDAEGEFCFVALDVRNRGTTAQALDASCQFLIDEEENRYMPDPEVMALDDLAVAGFGTEIGPGERVKNSALYYDVPKWTHPDALELREVCEGPSVRLALDPALRSDRLEG